MVENLMSQLVDIFIYDIFMGQSDRHSYNWGIIESENGIEVQSLYDNERMFGKEIEFFSLVGENLDEEAPIVFIDRILSPSETLLEFIQVSSGEYLGRFKDKIPLIEVENINQIISRVERRIESSIPMNVKKRIYHGFAQVRKNICDVIQKYEEGVRKK